MKRINTSKPEDKRIFTCPQCNKPRMSRPLDHIVNHEKREYTTFTKDTVELFSDICDFCMLRNKREHFEPSPSDIRRMMKALKEEGGDESSPSIEDLL